MKVLVLEDNPTGRTLITRVLNHLGAEVVEAANGLEGLVRLEKDDPDLAVLDLGLPVLDGFAWLSMVRASHAHANLPVVVVSGTVAEPDVRRLAGMGVADVLVKPLKPEITHDRLKKVFVTAGGWRQRKVVGSGGGRECLMLVEHDPNFRSFARPMLETQFDVVEVASSAEAMVMFRQNDLRPQIVCVGEGQQLLPGGQFVELMHQAAVEFDIDSPRLYLMTANPDHPDHRLAHWDGIIRKTFVPHLFKEAFEKVAMPAGDPRQRLENMLRSEMEVELNSAMQQTLGVMSGQDLSPLDAAALGEVPAEVVATIRLSGPALGVAVDVQLVGTRATVEQLGARVLRRPVTFEQGGSEVFGELVNTVAGRLRASLGPRGYNLRMETPAVEVPAADAPRPTWLATLGVETTAGDRLVLGLSVVEIPVDASAAEPAPAEPAANGTTGSVDDVLF